MTHWRKKDELPELPSDKGWMFVVLTMVSSIVLIALLSAPLIPRL